MPNFRDGKALALRQRPFDFLRKGPKKASFWSCQGFSRVLDFFLFLKPNPQDSHSHSQVFLSPATNRWPLSPPPDPFSDLPPAAAPPQSSPPKLKPPALLFVPRPPTGLHPVSFLGFRWRFPPAWSR